MTNRQRQVELGKIVAHLERAIRHREVKALLTVAVRHDGQFDYGAVVESSDVGRMIVIAGEACRKIVEDVARQQQAPGNEEALDKQGH
jgi:hypothetical protein